jgi:predicted dehydrogenase
VSVTQSTVVRSERPRGSARVGLAGLGAVSAAHLEAYAAMPEIDIAGAADPSPDARTRASADHDFVCYASVDELLAEKPLDVLCVLSPAHTHREVVETAAANGVAILCEKPLAAAVADAIAMVRACAEAGVPLGYGSSYRFLGSVRTAREIIASGVIGDVTLLVETLIGGSGPEKQRPIGPEHYPPGLPGGTGMGLIDHGVHFIDIAPWLVDRATVSASGRGNTSGGPLRPEFIVLELEGGILAHFLCFDGSWSTALPAEGQWLAGGGWDVAGTYLPPGSWGRDLVEIHVYGSRGALRIAPYAHRLYRSGPGGIEEVPINGPPPPHHFALQLRAFVDAVRDGRPPPVPGERGVEVLRVLHSVYSRPENGGRRVV